MWRVVGDTVYRLAADPTNTSNIHNWAGNRAGHSGWNTADTVGVHTTTIIQPRMNPAPHAQHTGFSPSVRHLSM